MRLQLRIKRFGAFIQFPKYDWLWWTIDRNDVKVTQLVGLVLHTVPVGATVGGHVLGLCLGPIHMGFAWHNKDS